MKIHTETHVIGNRLYLIVTDPMAGRRNRYTIHRINLNGGKYSKLVGSELPLGVARTVVKEDSSRRRR